MTEFTPLSAACGGLLIGIAAALLLLANGRIAGVSGILGSALTQREDRSWRLAFLVGLPLGAWGASVWVGGADVYIAGSPFYLMAAGFLVGAGTQWGSGCTSGHGVCGMARLSGRSWVATVTFMVAAAAVVFLRRHGWGG